MIQRFTFGCPLPTESVVLPVEPAAAVPYLIAEPDGSWSFSLAEDAVVYGLGEMPRGINKRGWHYVADNTDESHHGENRFRTMERTIFCSSTAVRAAASLACSWISRERCSTISATPGTTG